MRIIEQLFRLQELELGPAAATAAVKREIEALRAEVDLMPVVLGHYDRLVGRGKKAVALVRHGVCTGCQMQLPSGLYAKLLRDDDVCVCENCARYLKLAQADPPAVQAKPLAAAKRIIRRRRAAPAVEAVAA